METVSATDVKDIERRISDLDKSIEVADAQIEMAKSLRQNFLEAKLEIVRTYPLVCQKCGGVHMIHQWTFVQTQRYVRPHGCTGGDYWDDEGRKSCAVMCPSCKDKAIRILDYPDKDIVQTLADLWGFEPKQVFTAVRRGTWCVPLLRPMTLELFPEPEPEGDLY